MAKRILGISAYYHDSAAALVCDGEIVAAAQEERFTRKKHDAAFPRHAAAWCLGSAGPPARGPRLDRFLRQALGEVRAHDGDLPGLRAARARFVSDRDADLAQGEAQPAPGAQARARVLDGDVPNGGKLNDGTRLGRRLLFTEHHQAHAASAFFASPFARAAVLCLDGVGEWATTSMWLGEGNRLIPQWQIDFPHSLGLLYSAFTYYTGFRVNSGEYKVMGLAPYGEPRFTSAILEHLIDVKPDGTFRLNTEYFNYVTGLTMTNERFDALFGGPPRKAESPLTQREMDLAASIQKVTEEVVSRLARRRGASLMPTIFAWRAAWRSTASPTAACCAKELSAISGSSRPRATPAARSARRSPDGIYMATGRARSTAPIGCVARIWARASARPR